MYRKTKKQGDREKLRETERDITMLPEKSYCSERYANRKCLNKELVLPSSVQLSYYDSCAIQTDAARLFGLVMARILNCLQALSMPIQNR